MLRAFFNNKQASLIGMLSTLTLLFIAGQAAFFIIHYTATNLVDSLVKSSVAIQLMHLVVLLPMAIFIFLQITAYFIFIAWIWFMTVSLGKLFKLSPKSTYKLGVFLWCAAALALLTLNYYYYPASFFTELMRQAGLKESVNLWLMIAATSCLLLAAVLSYVNFFWFKRYNAAGFVLLILCMGVASLGIYDAYIPSKSQTSLVVANTKPNIIFIGLDSLRPDFTGFFGNQRVHTPNINNFMGSALTYTNAYTPLARTFPAWVSILTAKHPLHTNARNNLVYPENKMTDDTFAKRMQQAGYETIYATDEKRFSNITSRFGFDKVLGPQMGVNDFLLGGLSDFPMSNLLLKLPVSRFLFPYNYGNRAAAITYEPNQFLQMIKSGLKNRSDKPLFLTVHLCLSHWPFTWASTKNPNENLAKQYRISVEAVDKQLGGLLQLLKRNGLLENSIVVMLSDHGTALGLPGDRMLAYKTFVGNPTDINMVPIHKFSSAPEHSLNRRDYTINTTYGQGTNVLSFPQYRVLLAFKRYGGEFPVRKDANYVSLMDIAPTILDLLSLPPMSQADGISLRRDFSSQTSIARPLRAMFMETGDSMSEIETDHIYIDKVLKHQIGIYTVNPADGLLMINRPAEDSIIKNKQLAIMKGNWILAHYPARKEIRYVPIPGKGKLVPKPYLFQPYYVLANVQTGTWTIGFESSFAKNAPTNELLAQLKTFYLGEL